MFAPPLLHVRTRSIRFALAAAALALVPFHAQATETFFVSLEGNDAWSGRLGTPDSSSEDGPFATLERARNAVRERLADSGRQAEDVRVIVRGGVYSLKRTLTLDERDSGAAYAPVEWSAYPGEVVVLSGGKQVKHFRPLADLDLEHRLPAEAVGKVWVADLREEGISNFGTLERKGFQIPFAPGPLQLYYEGQPMALARFPNEDFVRVADVPQEAGTPHHPGHHDNRRFDNVPTGRHFGVIAYEGDRPSTWAPDDDIWVHGYWTWDWADSSERVSAIHPQRRLLTLAPPYHRYGITKGQRYYYYNIPEELDAPGEYYLDRERGLLFFWPPDGALDGEAFVSLLREPLLEIASAAHVRWHGFSLAHSRSGGVVIEDSEQVEFSGCRFFALGGQAFSIEGGTACGVVDSHFAQLDAGGVHLQGGDRSTLEPGDHYAINNRFHDFGQVYRTNTPAIRLDGVGHRAAHNLIHDAPHMGIYFIGNDHLIEYNEIHHIAKETGDVGAIYTGRDYTSRGTLIRFNYLHDLLGPGLHGVRGVYLDDFTSGIVVYGNLFVRAGRAAFIGGGRENLVQNNVFIECEPSVQVDGRGLSWAVHHFDQDHPSYASTLRDRMAAAKADQPPYATRYPSLPGLYADEPRVPKYNMVENNISVGGVFLDLFDGADTELVTVSGNLIGDPVAVRATDRSDQEADFEVFSRDDPGTREILEGNHFFAPPADFFRLEDGHPRLNYDALPAGSGFVPLPLEKMGLQSDGLLR